MRDPFAMNGVLAFSKCNTRVSGKSISTTATTYSNSGFIYDSLTTSDNDRHQEICLPIKPKNDVFALFHDLLTDPPVDQYRLIS